MRSWFLEGISPELAQALLMDHELRDSRLARLRVVNNNFIEHAKVIDTTSPEDTAATSRRSSTSLLRQKTKQLKQIQHRLTGRTEHKSKF
jgi:acetyl-CoA carboxylase alpha subunit